MHLTRRYSGLDSKGRLHISCDDMADIYKNFHISLNETYWNTASNHKICTDAMETLKTTHISKKSGRFLINFTTILSEAYSHAHYNVMELLYANRDQVRAQYWEDINILYEGVMQKLDKVFSHNDVLYKLTILLHFAALFSLYKDVAKEEFIVNLYKRAEEYIQYDQHKLGSSEKEHILEYFDEIQFIYRLRQEGKTVKNSDNKVMVPIPKMDLNDRNTRSGIYANPLSSDDVNLFSDETARKKSLRTIDTANYVKEEYIKVEKTETVKNESRYGMKTSDACINVPNSLYIDGSLPKSEIPLDVIKRKVNNLETNVRVYHHIDLNNPPPKPARALPLKNIDMFEGSSELLPKLFSSINEPINSSKENVTDHIEDNSNLQKTSSSTEHSNTVDSYLYKTVSKENTSISTTVKSPKYLNDEIKCMGSVNLKDSSNQTILLESYDYKSEFEKRFAKKKISVGPVTIPVIPKPHKEDIIYSYRRKGLFNDLDSRKSSKVTLQDEEEKNKSSEENKIASSSDVSASCSKCSLELENYLLENSSPTSVDSSQITTDSIVRAVLEERAVSRVTHREANTLRKQSEEFTNV